MSEVDRVIWAAGFFDGEGYIAINGRSLRANVTQVNRESLEILRDLFGGSISRTCRGVTSKHVAHRWEVNCRKAAQAIREMLPYLVVKRPQAELALAYQRLVGSARVKADPIVELQRAEIARRISERNQHPGELMLVG